jgi:DEAD/DEAH box helicase domain-containing protein
MAIDEFKRGHNVCISTSTSSGKTLVFNVCGIEILNKNTDAKILAIYPLKALGIEQEARWNQVIEKSGRRAGQVESTGRSRRRKEKKSSETPTSSS